MARTTARFLLAVTGLTAGVLLACSGTGGPLTDEEISLRPEGLLQVTAPAPVLYTLKDPGESRRLERAYYGAPPLIPHAVAGQVVNLESNDCLDCHEEGDADTPGLPPSHRIHVMFRVVSRERAEHGMTTVFDGFAKAATVSGNRYDCLLCHAPQATNAADLVQNTFKPVQPKDAHKDVLDQLNSAGKF